MSIIDGQAFGTTAEQLCVSERTVNFHSKKTYEKAEVSSKKDLL